MTATQTTTRKPARPSAGNPAYHRFAFRARCPQRRKALLALARERGVTISQLLRDAADQMLHAARQSATVPGNANNQSPADKMLHAARQSATVPGNANNQSPADQETDGANKLEALG